MFIEEEEEDEEERRSSSGERDSSEWTRNGAEITEGLPQELSYYISSDDDSEPDSVESESLSTEEDTCSPQEVKSCLSTLIFTTLCIKFIYYLLIVPSDEAIIYGCFS